MIPKYLVFCTSLIDKSSRCQDWIDYYTSFFQGDNVDLLMINDGPVDVIPDMRSVSLISFPEKLGRSSIAIFPGWKRSFRRGLEESLLYAGVAHVESDCYLRGSAKQEFMARLGDHGYWTGYTQKYQFPEAALQVLNDPEVVGALIQRYSEPGSFEEDVGFENYLRKAFAPRYFLSGERLEGDLSRAQPEHTYWAQCALEHFKSLDGVAPEAV